MKLEEKRKSGHSKKGGSKYRRRVFKCEDCGYTELIHADGARDLNQ